MCETHKLLCGKNAEIINVTAVGVYSNRCGAEGVSGRRKTQHEDQSQAKLKYDVKIPVTSLVSYGPFAQT